MIGRIRGSKASSPDPAILLRSQQCLCDHVGQLGEQVEKLTATINDLAGVVVALQEQLMLFHTTLKRADGRIDRAECWAHEQFGYPRTQAEIPNYEAIRKDIEGARRVG